MHVRLSPLALGVAALLAACTTAPLGGSAPTRSALSVLSLDYERALFDAGSVVSGAVAEGQRRVMVATPTFGKLREAGKGPIPTEIRLEVDRLVTRPGHVEVEGTLKLRDLGLGGIMAELPGFRASGAMPAAGIGARVDGLVFRGADDAIIAWLRTLECDTDRRTCGKAAVPATGEAVAELEAPTVQGADIELAGLVGNRTSGLRRINTQGIDPQKIVAEAKPVAPRAPTPTGPEKIGTTVAALGLLDRSGYWLQTPLVSSETQGSVRAPNGKSIDLVLVPKAGPRGGGSQMSLAAISALGYQMTDLISLEVFR